jgi:hypothetical protein
LKYDFKGDALTGHGDIMENFGYILSEAPFLILIVWSAVKLVRWRRSRENRPWFSDRDQQMLFHAGRYCPGRWEFYPRFVLAVLAVTTLGSLQIVALAPLGAAVLAATFLLTSAAVVHGVMLREP